MEQKINKCLRCGRILKNEKWQEIGYGPICYAKTHKYSINPLFNPVVNKPVNQN